MAHSKTAKTEQGFIEKVQGDSEPKPVDYAAEQPAADGKEAGQRAKAGAERAQESGVGAAQVQAKLDAEQEKGYLGEVVDPTPNEVYALPHPCCGEGDQVAPELLGATKGRALADAVSRGVTADDLSGYQKDVKK
jgi:hypothetical protein